LLRLAVTIGDINGIGPEVALKALALSKLSGVSEVKLIGPAFVIANLLEKLQIKLNEKVTIVEPELNLAMVEVNYGIPTEISGEVAFKSIDLAIEMTKQSKVDAIVTAPISKKALNMAQYMFSGHTEILQAAYVNLKAQMIFVSDTMTLLLLTRHLSLKNFLENFNKELIIDNVLSLKENLKTRFNIEAPKILIAALNPHGGESGTIGKEEVEIIKPAVDYLRSKEVNIDGPYSCEVLWKKAKHYDCVVALYHDQGLIPLKLIAGQKLVNVTIGLPLTRTSPCHGTAYDIAGKFVADETSMVYAIDQAIEMIKNQGVFKE